MRHALTATLTSLVLLAACGDDGTTGSGGRGGASGAGGDGGADSGQTGAPSSTASGTTSVGSTIAASTSTGSDTASSSASTGAGPIVCSGADPSFAEMVQPIFTESCAAANCHRGDNPDEDLDLSEGAAWAQIVGVQTEQCGGDRVRIAPGDPEASYLVSKIRGVDRCGTSRRMPPPNRAPLPDEQIQTIIDWVCSGAEDD